MPNFFTLPVSVLLAILLVSNIHQVFKRKYFQMSIIWAVN